MNAIVKQIKEQGLVSGKSYKMVGVGNLIDFTDKSARFVDAPTGKIISLPMDDGETLEVVDMPTVVILHFENLTIWGGKAIAKLDGVSVAEVNVSYKFNDVDEAKTSLEKAITKMLPAHFVMQDENGYIAESVEAYTQVAHNPYATEQEAKNDLIINECGMYDDKQTRKHARIRVQKLIEDGRQFYADGYRLHSQPRETVAFAEAPASAIWSAHEWSGYLATNPTSRLVWLTKE